MSQNRSSFPLETYIPQIITFAKTHYNELDDLHGLGHIERVLNLASKIHKVEGGYWPIILIIVWLHDTGHIYSKKQNRNHAIISKNMAEQFLISLQFPEQLVKEISHGILAHSFSIGEKAKTIEAKIVSDADKLDALGAIGIYRVCAFQAQRNQGIQAILHHFDEKLVKILDKIYLPYSEKIGIERMARIKRFQQEIIEELNDNY